MAAITNNATKVMANGGAGKKRSNQQARRSRPAKRRRRPRGGGHAPDLRDSAREDERVAADGLVGYANDSAGGGRSLTRQLEAGNIAQVAAQAAEREPNSAEKTARPEKSSSFLGVYFREMAALEVLRPEEEFSIAQNIESLEIAVWERVLGFPLVVGHVLKVVETCMDNALAEFRTLRRAAAAARRSDTEAARARLAERARACAEKLRALDTDKNYLDAVLAELDRIEQGQARRSAAVRRIATDKSQEFGLYLQQVRAAARDAARARNEFVKANLRLVVSIARRFNHGRMSLADLIQEGNIGLMKAVERYDYRRGFRFSTYASWWIRHAISRALADKGREVRLPVHMIDTNYRLAKAKRELTTKLGRQPTNEEIAEEMQLPVEKVEKLRMYLNDQSFSLDRAVHDEDERSYAEFLQDPKFEETTMADILALRSVTAEVRQALLQLKPIEADILRRRFGLDDDHEMTLKQIGKKYNLSRERIRQLQEQALIKVRRLLESREVM